jgi:hypothetical protein
MGRAGWEDEVAAMVEKGAAGTRQEINAVVDYMVKNFGVSYGTIAARVARISSPWLTADGSVFPGQNLHFLLDRGSEPPHNP